MARHKRPKLSARSVQRSTGLSTIESRNESRELAIRPMPPEVEARVQLALARTRNDLTARAQRWLAAYGEYSAGTITWLRLAGRTETYLNAKPTPPHVEPIRTGGKFDECGIPPSANRQRRRVPPRTVPRRGTKGVRQVRTRYFADLDPLVRHFL